MISCCALWRRRQEGRAHTVAVRVPSGRKVQCPLGDILPVYGPLHCPDRLLADHQEVAYEVMKLYLTDFTREELTGCISKAYNEKFDTEVIAPLAEAAGAYYLELFHGATIAFKDMALSILPARY